MNSRYTVAIHVLTLMAFKPDTRASSEYLAGSVNTNPVVIRKLLSTLRKAGYVDIQMGQNGGAMLAKDAADINLADIYRLFQQELFPMPPKKPSKDCLCGEHIQPVLSDVFSKSEDALIKELSRKSIKHITREIQKLSHSCSA